MNQIRRESMDIMEFMEKSSNNDSMEDLKNREKGRIRKIYDGTKKQYFAFIEEAGVSKKLGAITGYLEANPLLSCGLFAVLVGISTPIILFVIFAIINVSFVVAGFIILEVTIFIIGATVLACSVFFVVTAAAVIGLCLLSFYLIFCYMIIILKKFRI